MIIRQNYKLVSFITLGLILSVFLGLRAYAQAEPQENLSTQEQVAPVDIVAEEPAASQEEQVQAEQPIQGEATAIETTTVDATAASTDALTQLPQNETPQVQNENSSFGLIYSLPEQGAMNKEVITKTPSGISDEISATYTDKFANLDRWVYLSPDRKLIAVTVRDPNNDFDGALTYIADINGNKLTNAHYGFFVAWSPDSQKALLYLSGFENEGGRHIYYLGTNDTYYDSGLPERVIGADISPKDGSIVYSLTEPGTDRSDIYIRDKNGNDRLLVAGSGNILAWVRWSPDGNKIAFMKSDRWISSGQQSVWSIDSDGTKAEKISDIVWAYPPVWSPNGSKMVFSNAGNIWEYNVSQKALNKMTNFDKGGAVQPSYSQDGETVVFVSGASGQSQVWAVKNGQVSQLTNDNQEKSYPILP
jgi:Tol biopolymer transport system component